MTTKSIVEMEIANVERMAHRYRVKMELLEELRGTDNGLIEAELRKRKEALPKRGRCTKEQIIAHDLYETMLEDIDEGEYDLDEDDDAGSEVDEDGEDDDLHDGGDDDAGHNQA